MQQSETPMQRLVAHWESWTLTVAAMTGGMWPAEQTYFCQICLMHGVVAQSVELPCKHHFCRECLLGYCSSKIHDAVVDFTCPHIAEHAASVGDEPRGAVGCTQPIDEALLREVVGVGDELLAKLSRFRAMKDARYRECPSCQAPNTDGPSAARGNALTCASCGTVFCFEHGAAHTGRTCTQYTREQRAQRKAELASQAAIARHFRKCPNQQCGQPIEKSGGCNHMTCYRCQQDFCWLCGKAIARGQVGWHFNPANVSGCGGLLHHRHRGLRHHRCALFPMYARRALNVVLAGPQLLVWWAVALYVVLPLCLLAHGCLVGCGEPPPLQHYLCKLVLPETRYEFLSCDAPDTNVPLAAGRIPRGQKLRASEVACAYLLLLPSLLISLLLVPALQPLPAVPLMLPPLLPPLLPAAPWPAGIPVFPPPPPSPSEGEETRPEVRLLGLLMCTSVVALAARAIQYARLSVRGTLTPTRYS